MMVPSGGQLKVRSVLASLAIGLLFMPGCWEEGPVGPAPQPPPNPAPRADQGRTVEPKLPRTEDFSNAEKDLHKDLASPVIKPDVPTAPVPPPTPKAGGAKTGQP
jgi:hypothetical protein